MGPKIRELRMERYLTLEEAAERAGCTPGFLSQVERNQAVPSISMLYAIAQALNAKVAHFFPRDISGAKVVRSDSREVFHFEGSFMVYSLLSARYPERRIECLLVRMDSPAGAPPADEYRSHPGEEFAYVLDGALRLWLGDAVYDLAPGDSIHFRSTVKHRLENPGSRPMLGLWVLTPPVF